MKFLAVATPPPAMYPGCSTRKMFWEDKFTPENMKSCGRQNVRKHRDINNGGQYIILDISSKSIWTRGKSPLQNQGIIWEDQVRG